MLNNEQKTQLKSLLESENVRHSFDNERQRLMRACVAFWENDPRPVTGYYEDGTPWSTPKGEFLSLWDKETNKIRGAMINEFGEIPKGNMEIRKMGMIPKQLLYLMEEIFDIFIGDGTPLPDNQKPFATEKEHQWFYKNFNRYRLVEKI